MKSVTINSKTLAAVHRMDAGFHVALKEKNEEVKKILNKYKRKQLEEMIENFSCCREASKIVVHGSGLGLYKPKGINYTDIDLALYLVITANHADALIPMAEELEIQANKYRTNAEELKNL